MTRHASPLSLLFATLTAIGIFLGTAGPAGADECKDAWITTKVKTRLMGDDIIGVFKINVDTDECHVTLNGCVDARDQIARAADLARSVKKVRGVTNNLTICQRKDNDQSDD